MQPLWFYKAACLVFTLLWCVPLLWVVNNWYFLRCNNFGWPPNLPSWKMMQLGATFLTKFCYLKIFLSPLLVLVGPIIYHLIKFCHWKIFLSSLLVLVGPIIWSIEIFLCSFLVLVGPIWEQTEQEEKSDMSKAVGLMDLICYFVIGQFGFNLTLTQTIWNLKLRL